MARFTINIGESEGSNVSDNTLGEDVLAGDVLYLANDLKWYKASAAIENNITGELRLAIESGTAGEEVDLLEEGNFYYPGNPLTPSSPYYLSVNPGKITTSTTTSGVEYNRYIGEALGQSKFYFNPDNTYIRGDGKEVNGIKIDGDLNYIHDQINDNTIWIINHNLNKYPNVVIQNTAGETIIGKIVYIDSNNIEIHFNLPLKGTAYLN